MNKVTCNIIKDLLPLYIESVVSDDTRILVENHLIECEDCRREIKRIQSPIEFVADADVNTLKRIKKILRLKKIWVSIVTTVIISSLFILGIFLYQLELPVKYSETHTWTEETTIQGGLKVFQVSVEGQNLEMVEVSSNYNDKNNTMLHVKIVKRTFLNSIFSSKSSSPSIGVAEYWKEIEGLESILMIEFSDRTIVYRNGKEVE